MRLIRGPAAKRKAVTVLNRSAFGVKPKNVAIAITIVRALNQKVRDKKIDFVCILFKLIITSLSGLMLSRAGIGPALEGFNLILDRSPTFCV